MFIPEEMKRLPRWVCVWNTSKCPMQALKKKAASAVKPETWTFYDIAQEAVDKGLYDNLGFVFNGDGLVGIDIDAGFTEEGLLSPLSVDIMQACQSFTEKSRSGRGIHIYLRGKLPFKGKNNGSGVEIYSTGRYFIVTGQKLIYSTIVENQNAIDYIVEKYFTDVEKESANPCGDRKRIYSPNYTTVKNGKISISPSYPPIGEGSRHISLVSLAGQLHSAGYSKDDTYREVMKCNKEACKPPLPAREVRAIVNSIQKYKRR